MIFQENDIADNQMHDILLKNVITITSIAVCFEF